MTVKTRIAVAKDVKDKLFTAEAAIEDALLCAGDLNKSCIEGRKKAGLSAVAGSEAVANIASATAALHQARAEIIAAHNALADVRDELGLPAYASGGGWKPPAVSARHLSIVEQDETSQVA